ncbi:hypothetical protein J6590_061408 [Homalodisca vitripennis]|nr:hypothetical protein J6590_061408 [Homalodisca vitripennis]
MWFNKRNNTTVATLHISSKLGINNHRWNGWCCLELLSQCAVRLVSADAAGHCDDCGLAPTPKALKTRLKRFLVSQAFYNAGEFLAFDWETAQLEN